MALRKTALIRVPQLRRRRGRLCQSTCHGFPPAIRTRTVAWPGRDGTARPPRASLASHQVSAIAPSSVSLARASVAARTSKRRPRTKARRASHPRASPSHQRASRLAPASIGLRTRERRPRPRASANPYGAPKNRLDPRPSAPPPTKAAVPKHLPRFSSGHTDSHWRIAAASRRTPPATGAASLDPRLHERRPVAPAS